MLKNKKLWLMVFTLMCIIAMGVCAIVDYAINKAITWGYIPILSIVFGYLVIMPMFAKKHKIVLSLCASTLTILPFLYFMEKAISIEDWFYSLALPITICSIIAIWCIYPIIRFLKINVWYKISIIIFICGVILTPIINHIADGLPYISFQNFINVFSCLVVALICGIYGYIKKQKKITR